MLGCQGHLQRTHHLYAQYGHCTCVEIKDHEPGVIAVDYHTALHHGVAVSRQINEGPTFQAVNALAQHRPVVEVYKFAVLLAA